MVTDKTGNLYILLIVIAVVATLGFPCPLQAQAPSRGAGNLEYKGFVRVIDGNTFEIYPHGVQVGIGVIGIAVAQGNTSCGQLAASIPKALIPFGASLQEDLDITFDARKRRMYYIMTPDGRSVADELVKAGLAVPDGTGKDAGRLSSIAGQSSVQGLGCIGGKPTPGTKEHVRRFTAEASHALGRSDIVSAAQAGDSKTSMDAPLLTAAATTAPSTLAAGFSQTVIANGFNFPTNFAFVPDGRIFVAEKAGFIKVIKNGAVLPTPLIDISSQVNNYWDHGLIGFALDPNFASNGFIYLAYTYENDPVNYSSTKTARVSRYTVVGDTASTATGTVILGTVVGASCNSFAVGADCIPSDNPSHSAGSLKFDSAGNLFYSNGDGASFNVVDVDALRAQNLDSLGGKLLRVTPTGSGISTNPFWNGTATSNRSKIWSLGFRNPYRVSIRPNTSIPYVGDVGWFTWEEINVASAGMNFGWPCYEGGGQQPGYAPNSACQTLYSQGVSAVQAPLYTYSHNGISSAITGGVFSSGANYPAQFQGVYFFGDYAQSWLRYIQVDATNHFVGGPTDFLYNADGPVSINQGPDGNLYYLSIVKGELRMITYVGGSPPPLTVVSVNPAAGSTGAAVNALVQATFSALVDPSTVTTSTFTLAQQGTPVAATVAYLGSGPTATLTPNLSLLPGQVYTATVKGGSSGVKDLSGNPLASDMVWSFTVITIAPPPNGTSSLSDLNPTSSVNGWGPVERDMSNGENLAGDGHTITIRGNTFAKGLGTHAPADIRYNLGGRCSLFSATLGTDDEVSAGPGSVVFQVWGDGVKLYDSGLRTFSSAPLPASVNMAGKNELELVVTDGGDGTNSDHADWATAQITCGGAIGPIITGTTPANGATGVAANATVTATFASNIDPTTLNPGTFTLVKQGTGTLLQATVSYNNANLTASLQPTVALSSSTTYVATLKSGSNGVKDTTGVPLAADQIWSFTITANAGATFLSDLTWISMSNGYGPVELDHSNGENLAGDGHTITIRGATFAKGLGAHAPSDIKYNLGGGCTLFTAVVGTDDEVPAGSVVFQVWADGVQLSDSGLRTHASPALPVSVNISGKSQLELVVTNGGDGGDYDHADWANAAISCSTNAPPVPTITSPASSLLWKVGDVINFAGSATDNVGVAIPAANLSWNIILHHCPSTCHTHPFLSTTGASGSFTAPDHGDNSYFELDLAATDTAGRTGTTSLTIQPALVALNFATSPTGLQVVYNGSVLTAPTTVQTIIGSAHTISTTSPQGGLNFSSWSDAGAQQHDIVAPATAITFTANFGMVISAVAASGITTSGATVTWTTDQPSDSQVDYGTTTAYGSSSPLNATPVTSHSVALSGLTQGTLYHYRVKSKSSAGQLVTSGDFTFTTLSTGPVISAVSTSVITTTGATVTWTTDQASDSQVDYGTTASYGSSSALNATTVTSHSVALTGLTTGTLYHYRVKSKNAAGQQTISGDFTFTTKTNVATFLSNLTWISMSNGYGPVELDHSNGENLAGDGHTITIRGATFAKGLGAHAASDIKYNLGGSCSLFTATVGTDDEVPAGSVVFQVWADGAKLSDSGVRTHSSPALSVSVNISGKNQLELVVTDGGDGKDYDHADWANAKITCAQ